MYTYEGDKIYKPYNLFKIDNEEKELYIMNYHNNFHFELIYSIHKLVKECTLYNSFSEIKNRIKLKKNDIKIAGRQFEKIM